nr:hypothetical protein MACL_00002306 [Theileria orientalis]
MTGDKVISSSPLCQFVPAFISFTTYLTTAHIDSSSALFAVVLKIPIHNTSIYFDKLYNLRVLLLGTGLVVEYLFYVCANSIFKSKDNRIYISLINLFLILVTRFVFAALTHFSSQLAYHVYIILAVEAFFCGCLMSLTAIVPEHSVVVTLGYNVCRMFVPFFQFILDLMLHGHPLVLIKIQCWASVLLTAFALGSWGYYTHSCSNPTSGSKGEDDPEAGLASNPGSVSPPEVEVASFSETMREALSPFLMFPAASMFKDFLYPGVLPFSLLQREKCHIINILATACYGLASITFFVLERVGVFEEWNGYYDGFWVLTIPINAVPIYAFLAIHTRVPSAVKIRNSRPIVMAMTLSVILYYSFLYSLSYGGVPKVVHTAFKGKRKTGDKSVITFYVISTMVYRFFFSKLSVGYNHTRVALGYHLPKFRPNHRMSNSNTFWYIIKNMFKRAGKDIIGDFRRNIKNYL